MKIWGIELKDWATLIGAICGLIVTLIPTVIALISSAKARKEAKTEAEKAAATAEMVAYAEDLIAAAETTFKDVDAVLKSKGSSAGAAKKESVVTKLQAYALEKGFTFDANFWSEKINAIVALTKKVNTK